MIEYATLNSSHRYALIGVATNAKLWYTCVRVGQKNVRKKSLGLVVSYFFVDDIGSIYSTALVNQSLVLFSRTA
jgi:hypothetical protein